MSTMNDEQQKLVLDNMTLVHFLINKYYPTFCGNEDVVQAGMVGLCNAATTWKEDKSIFSTYASKCILNEIKRYFRESRSINALSLEYEYEGGITLSEAIEGDVDVTSTFYVEDFFNDETPQTKVIMSMYAQGYNSKEIELLTGIDINTIYKVRRTMKKRWEEY